jgi:chaperone required for assembly of F1-ATPase
MRDFSARIATGIAIDGKSIKSPLGKLLNV